MRYRTEAVRCRAEAGAPDTPDRSVMSGGAPVLREIDIALIPPISMAYIGDSVLEVHWRTHFIVPAPQPTTAETAKRVADLTRAEAQAEMLRSLRDPTTEFALSESEETWLRRGRNASPRGPTRVQGGVYRDGSALECLAGYLYLTDPPRLAQMLARLVESAPSPPGPSWR